MKKTVKWIFKFFVSSVLALAILSTFCLLYYNPPTAVTQPDLYTNHRFVSNAFWSNMTEGAGWGVTNEIGYNDSTEYNPELPTVAFIGSSQVEAQQVPQKKNFVSLTSNLFRSDENDNNDFQCINLGVGGHFLHISASNFEYFAEHYDGIDYVVLEVSTIYYNEEQINKILAGEYHSDLKPRSRLYQALQSIPYFRLLAKQWQDLNGNVDLYPQEDESINYEAYQQGMNQVIEKLANTAAEHDIQLIILYQHPLQLSADNTAQPGNDPKVLASFTECCKNNNVPFINMDDVMIQHFEETYQLPHGFSNSTPGTGHLNTLGHRLIAQEVYDEINRLTEGK